MVKVTVSAAKRTPLASTLPTHLELSESATVADLKTALAAKYPKVCSFPTFYVSVHRTRLHI